MAALPICICRRKNNYVRLKWENMSWQDLIGELNSNFHGEDIWEYAPNKWVKNLSNSMKGELGSDLYLKNYGGNKVPVNSLGYDLEHDGMKIESKLSTRSYRGNNCYNWQQIRPTDSYTHLWLVAVDLDSVRTFLVPRDDVRDLWKQHGIGKESTNSYHIKTSPREPIKPWMLAFECFAQPRNVA